MPNTLFLIFIYLYDWKAFSKLNFHWLEHLKVLIFLSFFDPNCCTPFMFVVRSSALAICMAALPTNTDIYLIRYTFSQLNAFWIPVYNPPLYPPMTFGIFQNRISFVTYVPCRSLELGSKDMVLACVFIWWEFGSRFICCESQRIP